MPSSRIIKSSNQDGTDIAEFSYRPIHASSRNPAVPVIGSFMPMELFQSQELSDVEEPPLIEISEEELQRRTDDAFNAGLKDGKELTERGLVNVFKALRGASETIHSLRDKVLRESEDELVELVMMVARKVIIREVKQDRTILAEVVKNALAGLSAREEITVRICPDDYQLVTSGSDKPLHDELVSERFLLKPDPTVTSGFCEVDTDMGTIDATLDAQLEEIYRQMLEQRTDAASASGND